MVASGLFWFLFHNIIYIFHLPDDDGGAVCLVAAANGRGMGLTAIKRAFLRDAMPADRLTRLWLEGVRGQEGLDRIPAAGWERWAVSSENPCCHSSLTGAAVELGAPPLPQ